MGQHVGWKNRRHRRGPPAWLSLLACFLSGAIWAAQKPATGDAGAPQKSRATKQPSLGDAENAPDAVEDGDRDSDDDFSELMVPVEALANVKTMDRLKFSQALRSLLVEGMPEKGDGTAAAKRHFEVIRRVVPEDPRGLYAYGIVLMAQNKPTDAVEQFQAVVQRSKLPYLPALRGVAWVHTLRGNHARGLPAMSALAHQVEDSKGAWPTAPARERSAEWLGQMIGYLAGPGKSAGPAAAIDRLQEEVEKLLTGDRKAAYELGLAGIAARYDELQALAARPPEEIEAEVNLKKKAIRAALVAAENEVQRIRDEIADIKGPLDKRIATSNREVRMNAPKVGRLRRSIEDQTALVDDLSQPRKYQRVTTSRSTTTRGTSRTTTYIGTRNETTQEKKAREEELATAKAALVEMQADLEKMSQGLDESKNDRDDAKAEIKEATADLWRKLTAAQKQLKEATARARTADQTLLTPASLKLRMTALETYLQYDPGVEKERLLASLKAPTTK